MNDAFAIFTIVASIAGIVWFIWIVATDKKDRRDEDRARAYFDRHGHWPDEAPTGEPPRS